MTPLLVRSACIFWAEWPLCQRAGNQDRLSGFNHGFTSCSHSEYRRSWQEFWVGYTCLKSRCKKILYTSRYIVLIITKTLFAPKIVTRIRLLGMMNKNSLFLRSNASCVIFNNPDFDKKYCCPPERKTIIGVQVSKSVQNGVRWPNHKLYAFKFSI